jgi:hypothetical protein
MKERTEQSMSRHDNDAGTHDTRLGRASRYVRLLHARSRFERTHHGHNVIQESRTTLHCVNCQAWLAEESFDDA